MAATVSETDENRVLLGIACLIGGAICIGFAPIGLRLSVGEGMGSQATGFWRFVLALPFIFALVLLSNKRLPAPPNRFALMAGLFFALDIGFWHFALTKTSVANATFIVNLGNVGVGLAAWIFLKERPPLIWGIAVLLALSGAAMLSSGATGGVASLEGDALALIAAVLVSGYMLSAKLARRTLGPLDVLFWATFVEVIIGFGLVFAFGEDLWPKSGAQILWPFVLALVVQVLGQGLIIAGVGMAPATTAGITVLLQPVVAAAISWPLFGEALATWQFVGAALIMGGLALSQVKFPVRRSPAI